MRTTIDMPDSLMRAAKVRASARGESLKDLVNRAIAHELGLAAVPREKAGRVSFPLIGLGATPAVLITNDGIEDAVDADDIERYGSP
jgi:hypothetical protein